MSCQSPWGFFYKGIKNIRKRLPTCARCRWSSESVMVVHEHRSAGGPVLSSEPGLAEDREVEKHASGYSFLLLVSLKWASAAGCMLPLTHPMTHGAYGRSAPFRCGPPCDLVALREFWKSEKPSVRGTCSNMSMLHDYMVLRSKEKCKREKADNAIYSLFHGSYE